MAIILCDWHNQEHPADVMVSQLANGETFAACQDGFLSFCVGMVERAAENEAQAADDDALARLEEAGPAPSFPTPPESSDADGAPGPSPSDGGSASAEPEPTTAEA